MRASAPASSANLGPGFDCLAVALDLRCVVEVARADAWDVGPDPDGFLDEAARRLSDEPVAVSVDSGIPIGRGLGSSAAILAALATAMRKLRGLPADPDGVFEFVAAREGHVDNAAAAVYGGLVYAGPGGFRRLGFHPRLRLVIGVPSETLPTSRARSALPGEVPFGVGARTASRLVRLIEGLRTGDIDLLRSIEPDELHEPYRIALRPVINDLMAAARGSGAALVALSGAGPSVLAVTTEDNVEAVRAGFHEAGSTTVLTPAISAIGAA